VQQAARRRNLDALGTNPVAGRPHQRDSMVEIGTPDVAAINDPE
jgi:hypothetical protein